MKRVEVIIDTIEELEEFESWLSVTEIPVDSLDIYVSEDQATHFYFIKDGKWVKE